MNAITLANDLRNSIFHNVNYYFTEEKKLCLVGGEPRKYTRQSHTVEFLAGGSY